MEKITVMCPNCRECVDVYPEVKNTRVLCLTCNKTYMAYEVVACKLCGKLRHPNHHCSCSQNSLFLELIKDMYEKGEVSSESFSEINQEDYIRKIKEGSPDGCGDFFAGETQRIFSEAGEFIDKLEKADKNKNK